MTIAITAAERRRKRLRRMAQLCLLLIVLIVVLSAFLRHRGVGLGCEDWPACYGQELRLVQQGEVVAAGNDVLFARVVHRMVASVMLILVVALVFSSLARPRLRREGRLALSLLALALGLAALGVVTPGSLLPAVTLGNLLGGFAMLALCTRMIAVTTARSRDGVLTRMSDLVAILLVLQIALGALVSAAHAGLSCRSLAECMELTAGGGWNFTGLNPWQLPSLDVMSMASAAAGAPIQLVHRIVGLVVAVAVLAVSLLAWLRGRRRSALALAGLLLTVVVLGIFIAQGSLSLPAVLLHNLSAASLLAMLGVTGCGTVNPAGRAIVIQNADMDAATAWRDGKVSFRSEPLEEAVGRLNRYSRVRVEVDGAALAAEPISGVFEVGNAARFVDALQRTLPVVADPSEAGIIRLRLK